MPNPRHWCKMRHKMAGVMWTAHMMQEDLFIPQSRTQPSLVDGASLSLLQLSATHSHHSPSVSRQQFRVGLKTHLFKEAYMDNLSNVKGELHWTELNWYCVKSISFTQDRASIFTLIHSQWWNRRWSMETSEINFTKGWKPSDWIRLKHCLTILEVRL